MSQTSAINFSSFLTDQVSGQIDTAIEKMTMQFTQNIGDSIMEAGLISLGGIASSAVSLHGLLGSHLGKASHETTITNHNNGSFSIHDRIHYDNSLSRIHTELDSQINVKAEHMANDARELLHDMGQEVAIEMASFANQLPLQAMTLLDTSTLPSLDAAPLL